MLTSGNLCALSPAFLFASIDGCRSCVGMMLTTLMSYVSHSQVWALERGGSVYVGGKSNRATVGFATELGNMLEEVPRQPSVDDEEGLAVEAAAERA